MQELSRKGKTVEGVARLRRGEYRARRIKLESDWVIQPRSRQLLLEGAQGKEAGGGLHDWLVEPSHLVAQKDSVLVARTLCQQRQAQGTIPVEVYNPTDKPVHLYAKTTLEILTPIQELTAVQLETVPAILK